MGRKGLSRHSEMSSNHRGEKQGEPEAQTQIGGRTTDRLATPSCTSALRELAHTISFCFKGTAALLNQRAAVSGLSGS